MKLDSDYSYWQVFFFVYALEYNVTREIALSYPINPKARAKIAGIVWILSFNEKNVCLTLPTVTTYKALQVTETMMLRFSVVMLFIASQV